MAQGERVRNKRTAGPQSWGMLSARALMAQRRHVEPIKCGIYFLFAGDDLMYVGQSIHIDARISGHLRWRAFDSWTWVPCSKEDLNALERRYIDAFMPPWNRDSATAFKRGRPIALKAPAFNGWPLSPEQKAADDEWRDYCAAHWTPDQIQKERMRRLRAKRADPNIRLEEFGPLPEEGDRRPTPRPLTRACL